uniref:Uncharacterized protein n=1 Tax=Rhizophora mucronata TaxID=61149 RepID=A0A2P2P852_RHIMU
MALLKSWYELLEILAFWVFDDHVGYLLKTCENDGFFSLFLLVSRKKLRTFSGDKPLITCMAALAV